MRKWAWFKKGSGTVVRSTLRAVSATVPDLSLNHAGKWSVSPPPFSDTRGSEETRLPEDEHSTRNRGRERHAKIFIGCNDDSNPSRCADYRGFYGFVVIRGDPRVTARFSVQSGQVICRPPLIHEDNHDENRMVG